VRSVRRLQISYIADLLLVVYSILALLVVGHHLSSVIADVVRKRLSITEIPSADGNSNVLVYSQR
jgi:hypothetical protein